MTGAAFILIITVSVASLFCAAFIFISLYDRSYVSARWFAASYAMGVVYAVAEFLLPYFSDIRFGVFFGHIAFLTTLTLLNFGLAKRYNVPLPINLLVAAFSLSLVASALLQDLPRGELARLFLYQSPYFAMQAIGAMIVMKANRQRPIDRIVAIFLAISALHYLTKPFLAVQFGGSGIAPQNYLETTYAMISQSMGAVMVVATGLLLLAVLGMDIMKSMVATSETDLISGLLNRRGFEQRLSDVARNRSRNGIPSALVMCDLDHFKRINDTYGHAFGDRVIALFAQILERSTASHHFAARIGGEEFAVMLPGSNLAAGRLFAETVRSNFSEAELEQLGSGIRFTASFGVAEIQPDELPEAFMARADGALYEAKRAGRDCVRVSSIHDVIKNDVSLGGR